MQNAQASAADLANLDLSLHAELALDYFRIARAGLGRTAADERTVSGLSNISWI